MLPPPTQDWAISGCHNTGAPGWIRRGLGMLLPPPNPNHGLWGRPAATLREVRPAEQGSACRSGLAFRRQENTASEKGAA